MDLTTQARKLFEQDRYAVGTTGVEIVSVEEQHAVCSLLADDIWTAGAVVIPQTINYEENDKKKSRKWNASLRFNIRATKVDRDWSE